MIESDHILQVNEHLCYISHILKFVLTDRFESYVFTFLNKFLNYSLK